MPHTSIDLRAPIHDAPRPEPVRSPASAADQPSARTRRAVATQRRVWGRRAARWEHDVHGNPGLLLVLQAVLDAAGADASWRAVDLGCGSGQLTLPLADRVGHVTAVDVSTRMTGRLAEHASAAGVTNITTLVRPIEGLAFAPDSLDLIVSNYALHHLRDGDKRRLVAAAACWLRPGGRLVIGDMMFGRGRSADDRQIIAGKVRALMRHGPAGWWRVAKNVGRYLLRVQERPASLDAWVGMLHAAGLESVEARRVVAEAALVSGRRPDVPATGAAARPGF